MFKNGPIKFGNIIIQFGLNEASTFEMVFAVNDYVILFLFLNESNNLSASAIK